MIRRAAAVALLALAGCAHQGAPELPTSAARLLAIDDFDLRGRIGVRTAIDGFNGSLRWSQRGDDLDLLIFGPLGVGRTELRGSLSGVEIVNAKGERAFFADPDRAFDDNFGWSLPLRALRYWALGVPEPGVALDEASYDPEGAGRLTTWRQNGWQVDVTQYRSYDAWVLPRKLTLSSGATTIKLVVSDWQIAGSTD